jgi:hypothetical protein
MRNDWRDTLRRWWPSGLAEGAGPLADWLVRDRAAGNAADPRQFSAWLPYRAYDADGALFQNRDGVGFCLDVLPQAGADERMAEILQSLVANCPPGAGLQLHLFASPAVRGMLTRYANLRVKDTDHLPRMQAAGRPVRQKNVFRALARKRVGFLLAGASRSLTQGFHYTVRDFRLVLSVHLPGRLRDFARREELLSLREAMITTPSNGAGIGIRCVRSCSSISATLNCACSGCPISAHSARHRAPSQALTSTNEPKRCWPASIQIRRRLSCTFFSTTPFSQPEATLQKSASNR